MNNWETICVDGITYRPLHVGVIREHGDVFFDETRNMVFDELPSCIGTPQPSVESDEPLSQSYRPVLIPIPK